ncbi:hypothetical protein EBZ37_12870, partial [bacterium]|nr:hypothetical protein [bacterium]
MFRFASPLHRQLEPELQSIEVWSAMAIPSFRVVGLPGPEIIESCERVRAAIEASQLQFPRRRVLVNLSPAGVRKQGTGTDLAIALAIGSPEQLQTTDHQHHGLIVASGELALNGAIRSAGRVLRTLVAAINAGAQDLILATEDLIFVQKSVQLLRKVPEFCGRPWPRIHLSGSLSEAIRSLRNLDQMFDDTRATSEPEHLTYHDLLP